MEAINESELKRLKRNAYYAEYMKKYRTNEEIKLKHNEEVKLYHKNRYENNPEVRERIKMKNLERYHKKKELLKQQATTQIN